MSSGKWIKNVSGQLKNYGGQNISDESYYEIQPSQLVEWSNMATLLVDIASSAALMARDDSGTKNITDINTAINFLKGLEASVTILSVPAFSAKTVVVNGVTKKIFARNTGFQQALTTGANTISYSLTYPWCKILGVEVIGAETLDYCDFEVFDNASGTYSGYPNLKLNQFAYSVNIPKDYYIRSSQFDADIYQGMIIKITYNSVSAKTVGINLIMNEVKD